MSDTIILETPRLVLTMWDKGDAELVRQLHSTIETTRYLSGSAPWTLEKAEERLKSWFGEQARDGVTKYKLVRRDDGRFIGRAGFSRFQEERGRGDFELGYSLRREAWGKGYATEIARALAEWFFKRGFANQFIAFTHPGKRCLSEGSAQNRHAGAPADRDRRACVPEFWDVAVRGEALT